MRVVIQRVKNANVEVSQEIIGSINKGLLLFVGIESEDTSDDIEWCIRKTLNMRLFNDENEVMNKSLVDCSGELLVISQFTLHASTKKGNRPSYIASARPEIAEPLYEEFLKSLRLQYAGKVNCGKFGADMQVSLNNDGPVTIIIDSKRKE
ncbi:MAG: D-tyrosyl-tRNA(Tyr) deacylase [Sphingobacteriales bacterium]|jgi:D-tyrosyl-tRNA(Tyr) deacylase